MLGIIPYFREGGNTPAGVFEGRFSPPAPGLRLFLRQQGNLSQGIMPDILAFYESEEGQREFAEWKKQREAERQKAETKK